MANTVQARKRVRQAVKRRQRNVALKSKLRTHVKNVFKAISSGDKEIAKTNYLKAMPVIDSSVIKGIIHKNKAARYKSRLNRQIKSL
ncbi:MAG: 30S ribosomal protein S20 [Pseudomonadota bacterium]|nr:30S ribosomal protein S20 [Pseudomonadota bacterium]|tara:strand:+ start:7323 stop:7583 length:261 start_codon:yes stop_codon:yes gene_type:complete